jgi:hypothetical protein
MMTHSLYKSQASASSEAILADFRSFRTSGHPNLDPKGAAI